MEKLDGDRFSGKVHSVFRRTINITGADGELYSLVSEKMDNAPYTLRVNLQGYENLTCLGIETGTDVYMKNGFLIVGTTTVHIVGTQLWREALPVFPAKRDQIKLEQNLAALRQTIRMYGQAGGLKGLIDDQDYAVKDVFSRLLKERSESMLSALAVRDFSLAASAGRSLLGLGGGQTPSGDDFCTGLLTVMHLPGGPFDEAFHHFGRYLAAEARQLTTEISQAMLARAAEGRVREKLICLLCEIAQGSQESTALKAREVINIGSMSGTDMAVGIAAGLALGLNLERVEKEENYGNTNYHQEECVL